MLDLILTVLFGWAGYWKFKNGKIALGIIWLITFGAFGIGWLFDIVCALVACSKTTKSNNQQPTVPAKALPPKQDHVQEAASQPVTQNATMQRPATPVPASYPIQHKVDLIQQPIAPSPSFSVKITTRSVELDPVGALSYADIGKPIGPLGCYLSYTPRILEPPTEKQLAYLKDLGVPIPEGITKIDASCMISRATGDDSMNGPSPELVALALALGVKFSAFIGSDGLIRYIAADTRGKDHAAFYAYVVKQSRDGRPVGNMLADPDKEIFYTFADVVMADDALVRSLNGRDPSDFLRPNKGTSIYKQAVAFLEVCANE